MQPCSTVGMALYLLAATSGIMPASHALCVSPCSLVDMSWWTKLCFASVKLLTFGPSNTKPQCIREVQQCVGKNLGAGLPAGSDWMSGS